MISAAIDADEYRFFTGNFAPEGFAESVLIAQQVIDAHTLYAYVGRDMESMPGIIRTTYKQAVAMQTLAISQRGGVAGISEENYSSVTIGQFGMAGKMNGSVDEGKNNDVLLSSAVRALLPILVAYGRGLRK